MMLLAVHFFHTYSSNTIAIFHVQHAGTDITVGNWTKNTLLIQRKHWIGFLSFWLFFIRIFNICSSSRKSKLDACCKARSQFSFPLLKKYLLEQHLHLFIFFSSFWIYYIPCMLVFRVQIYSFGSFSEKVTSLNTSVYLNASLVVIFSYKLFLLKFRGFPWRVTKKISICKIILFSFSCHICTSSKFT
jgi:hypothetical protein